MPAVKIMQKGKWEQQSNRTDTFICTHIQTHRSSETKCWSLRGKKITNNHNFFELYPETHCQSKTVQACTSMCTQHFGKTPLVSLQTKKCACTHTCWLLVKWQKMKAAIEYDFLLKTELNDSCQHDLISSNTSPEPLRGDHHFHNVLCIVWRYAGES